MGVAPDGEANRGMDEGDGVRTTLRSRLLEWYRAHRRDLPWRRTRDPYRVWISEVMLQQTRVETVLPYYERFLERWPTVSALASADPGDVRAAWSGLGYYRRAALMLAAAGQMAREHGAAVPGDHAALARLPGFGRYTAGAVASIAFDGEHAAVDGNVQRALARIFGIGGDVSTGAGNAAVWRAAESLVRGESPGELNQALIELGATVCASRSPRCLVCPVRSECWAHRAGRASEIPPPRRRARRGVVEVTALLVFDDAWQVVLERQPESGLFGGLWCLPVLEGRLDQVAAQDEAMRKYGWPLVGLEEAGEVKHVLTHRDILMRIHRARERQGAGLELGAETLARVDLRRLDRIALPSMTARALAAGLPATILGAIELPGRRTRAARAPDPV